MFAAFQSSAAGLPRFLEQAAQERLLLILNHVLAAEPVAQQRLQPHGGRSLRLSVQGWPALAQPFLPAPTPWAVRITPAGLFEADPAADPLRLEAAREPDLEVVLDASNPLELFAKVASGQTPTLRLAGDAALAADVNWLAENIRWDIAADLERVFGPIGAEQMRVWGLSLMQGVREAITRLAAMAPQPPRN